MAMNDGHDFQLNNRNHYNTTIAIQPLLCDLLLAPGSKTTFDKNIFASAL